MLNLEGFAGSLPDAEDPGELVFLVSTPSIDVCLDLAYYVSVAEIEVVSGLQVGDKLLELRMGGS